MTSRDVTATEERLMIQPHFTGHRYGLHSAHGFFPARTASSRLAYRTRFCSEIFAAALQPAQWKTCDRFEAT